jgi:hypothetical protein
MKPYELYDARTGELVWMGFLNYEPTDGLAIQVNPQPDESKPDQKPRVYIVTQRKLTVQETILTEIGRMRIAGIEIDPATGKPIEPLVQTVTLKTVH